VASTANSVFFGGAALLSEVWFPDSERATATAIGAAIAPQLGIMIALGLSPVIIHSDMTDPVCNGSFSRSGHRLYNCVPGDHCWCVEEGGLKEERRVALILIFTIPLLAWRLLKNSGGCQAVVSKRLDSLRPSHFMRFWFQK